MSRRRRGLLLVGLALVLGALAAADVSRREAALDRRLAPLVPVLVARADLDAGPADRASTTSRRASCPARWAPLGAAGSARGRWRARRRRCASRAARTSTPPTSPPRPAPALGAAAASGRSRSSPPARRSSSRAGARVDVLVTREDAGTRLALQDVEVLAPDARAADADGSAERVAATLRVTVRQAVYLTAAQSFAREVRLLPRAAGDAQLAGPVEVGEGLG